MKKVCKEKEKWSLKKTLDFQKNLLSWYNSEKRNLPWRMNQDPYRIWISEIMLQQTRVDTVIPYFERFIDWFPTIEKLAQAPEDKLLKGWEGLGYYSRVRNLQVAAQEILLHYEGEMPRDLKQILTLKGIGPYTAGAILSIAFHQAVPAVDGNVMRVYSRLFCIKEDIGKPATRKIFEEKVHETISKEYPGDFNQAIMDLGSAICTPKSPQCSICPVANFCLAHQNEMTTDFPVKLKKVKAKPVYYYALIIQNEEGDYLIERRPSVGVLKNMWTFPLVEMNESEYLQNQAMQYQKNSLEDTKQLSF